MKKLLLLPFVLLYVSTFAQEKKQEILPASTFDEALATDKLAFGTATINGIAKTRQKITYGLSPDASKSKKAPKGTLVTLFPITPYFEEFLKLRRQKENKNTVVYLSKLAFKYRLETTTDENGRFTFTKLKPGRYYIESMVPYQAEGGYTQRTGTVTDYNIQGQALSSSPVYEKFFYSYDAVNRETKIVEIKKDGQVLNINL